MAGLPESALFHRICHPQKRAFLLFYSKSLQLVKSCQKADIDRQLHYHWLKKDEAYAEAFQLAKQIGIDWLEEQAIQRATDAERPSDTLLIFTLKGALPEKYRDNVKIDTDITFHLESSLQHGVKRLELLRGSDSDQARIA